MPLLRLLPLVGGYQPQGSGSWETTGQGGLGCYSWVPVAPGSQRTRLEMPCTSQHKPVGGGGQGYFWRKLCFRPAFAPRTWRKTTWWMTQQFCAQPTPGQGGEGPHSKALRGCWVEARMDTLLEAALLVVVEGALLGHLCGQD